MSGDRQKASLLPEADAVNGTRNIGESSNPIVFPDDHGLPINVGNGDIIVEEQSSPCYREGSSYEDMGYDCMVSEGGGGVPPSD